MTVNPALAELGRRLESRRKEASLTVEFLAVSARVDPALVARFERGEGGLTSVALARLADRLGLPSIAFLHTKAPSVPAPKDPAVMLRASRMSVLDDADFEALGGGLRRARAFHDLGRLVGAPDFSESFVPSSPSEKRSWEDGYKRARVARSLLVAREERSLPSLVRVIEDDFNILVARHDFSDELVLGASCRSGPARLIAISASIRFPSVRRFVLAHELGHHLCDLGEDGAIEDHDWGAGAGFWLENPTSEKRANAFAAMFLAPDGAVRRELGTPRSEGYGLDEARELANRGRKVFGIGFAAMAWHLYNLRYFKSDETVRALLSTPENEVISDFNEESEFDGLERRTLEAFYREKITGARARELLGRPIDTLIDR